MRVYAHVHPLTRPARAWHVVRGMCDRWASPSAAAALSRQIARARRLNVHLLLVHELPSPSLPGPADERAPAAAPLPSIVADAPDELREVCMLH